MCNQVEKLKNGSAPPSPLVFANYQYKPSHRSPGPSHTPTVQLLVNKSFSLHSVVQKGPAISVNVVGKNRCQKLAFNKETARSHLLSLTLKVVQTAISDAARRNWRGRSETISSSQTSPTKVNSLCLKCS